MCIRDSYEVSGGETGEIVLRKDSAFNDAGFNAAGHHAGSFYPGEGEAGFGDYKDAEGQNLTGRRSRTFQRDGEDVTLTSPKKTLLNLDISGDFVKGYLGRKGVQYMIIGRDDETDGAKSDWGHIGSDPLKLGTSEVSFPNTRVTIRLDQAGGKMSGFRVNQKSSDGTIGGLKPSNTLTWDAQ